MALEFPDHVGLVETLALYEGRIQEGATDLRDPIVLNLEDPDGFDGRLAEIVRRALPAMEAIWDEGAAQVSKGRLLIGKDTCLASGVVDPTIPLSFCIEVIPSNVQEISFDFVFFAEDVEAVGEEEIWRRYRMSELNAVTEFWVIYNYAEQTAELFHRKTTECYRGQGFASRLMPQVETLLKGFHGHRGQTDPLPFELDTNKLDVMTWAHNQGFRPASPEDEEKWKRVLDGDENFFIDHGLRVMERLGGDPELKGESVLIKFAKPLEPVVAPAVQGVQDEAGAAVDALARR